ncbi:signal recognition particle 9 kDa protein-domain-containing protein [Paraphoma chrysanthemicola]|uniref:Signal recognition particle 9 kDa protein-domain-containing protein n=1 Tax=Paraphoma chrysanthemicola TaxID=798071 RepID=A0A8K0R437_9PLEO|nr:signal recognition particle 9 kDa protein-domain-containing protein [Paraphoma chrysanthemicola]
MPYFKTSAEWYEQSSLLLKARPTTTRITSKYSVLKPSASKVAKRKSYAAKHTDKPPDTSRSASPPPQPQAPEDPTTTFTLKTYDPESGTCLQYETNKAAEVGRLIGNLGRLGRSMAALPDAVEDLSAPAGRGDGVSTPQLDEGGDVKMGGVPVDPKAGAPAGGKKKKKGKK